MDTPFQQMKILLENFKNIIFNAKNSNLLPIRADTPTNIRILNKQRHITYDNYHRTLNFLDEVDKSNFFKDKMNRIRKYNSKNILNSYSLTSFYKIIIKIEIKNIIVIKIYIQRKIKGMKLLIIIKFPKKLVIIKKEKVIRFLKME